MIYQENSRIIIMVTNEIEKAKVFKCGPRESVNTLVGEGNSIFRATLLSATLYSPPPMLSILQIRLVSCYLFLLLLNLEL